jgi:hypothetical protein
LPVVNVLATKIGGRGGRGDKGIDTSNNQFM